MVGRGMSGHGYGSSPADDGTGTINLYNFRVVGNIVEIDGVTQGIVVGGG